MKEFLDKIKKYFSIQKSFQKKPINPHKHWEIALFVFFTSVLLLVAFSLFLLYEIKNDKFFQGSKGEDVNKNVINQKLFDKVMKDFNHKAQRMEELKIAPEIIKDPSL